jgi:hypothetical protein
VRFAVTVDGSSPTRQTLQRDVRTRFGETARSHILRRSQTASVTSTEAVNRVAAAHSGPTHSRGINLIHGIAQISSRRDVKVTTPIGWAYRHFPTRQLLN